MPKKGALHAEFAKAALETIRTQSDNYTDVYEVIIDADSFDALDLEDRDAIVIPIIDVYNAIFENGVIDIPHLIFDDAAPAQIYTYTL